MNKTWHPGSALINITLGSPQGIVGTAMALLGLGTIIAKKNDDGIFIQAVFLGI